MSLHREQAIKALNPDFLPLSLGEHCLQRVDRISEAATSEDDPVSPPFDPPIGKGAAVGLQGHQFAQLASMPDAAE